MPSILIGPIGTSVSIGLQTFMNIAKLYTELQTKFGRNPDLRTSRERIGFIPRIDLSWLFPLMDGPIDLRETSTSDFKHSLTSKLKNLSLLKDEYKSRNRDEGRVVTLILMIPWT